MSLWPLINQKENICLQKHLGVFWGCCRKGALKLLAQPRAVTSVLVRKFTSGRFRNNSRVLTLGRPLDWGCCRRSRYRRKPSGMAHRIELHGERGPTPRALRLSLSVFPNHKRTLRHVLKRGTYFTTTPWLGNSPRQSVVSEMYGCRGTRQLRL